MNSSIFKLGIIRESRIDEYRAPIVPKHIKELKKNYYNINIIMQPSVKRCFSDKEYQDAGAKISEDLSSCDLILGVKEIDINILIEHKKYLFFSHTSSSLTLSEVSTSFISSFICLILISIKAPFINFLVT